MKRSKHQIKKVIEGKKKSYPKTLESRWNNMSVAEKRNAFNFIWNKEKLEQSLVDDPNTRNHGVTPDDMIYTIASMKWDQLHNWTKKDFADSLKSDSFHGID